MAGFINSKLNTPKETVKLERRAVEFRAEGNGTLSGVLIPYGVASDVSGLFRETFRAGSIRYGNSVLVNRQHDRARPLARLGSGLTLSDSPESLRASVVLPDTTEGRDCGVLVTAGICRGLSAEFRAIREDWPTSGERVILEAELIGLAIVDEPMHSGAVIDELRAKADDCTTLTRARKWWF